MEYDEVKAKYDIAKKRFSKFRDEIDKNWDWVSENWNEYRRLIWESEEYRELEDWSAKEKCMRKVYKLRDPDEWEKDLAIPVEDFLAACHCGGFTDYDGNGCFGTSELITDISVYPSVLLKAEALDIIPKNFTHIWWYNK